MLFLRHRNVGGEEAMKQCDLSAPWGGPDPVLLEIWPHWTSQGLRLECEIFKSSCGLFPQKENFHFFPPDNKSQFSSI